MKWILGKKKVLKEELQLMRDGLMNDMKIMLEKQLLDKMKTMIKEEIADEKDSFFLIIEGINKLKSDVDKAVNFMNKNFELIMYESKELKGKFSIFVNENKVLNVQLKDMQDKTTSHKTWNPGITLNLTY